MAFFLILFGVSAVFGVGLKGNQRNTTILEGPLKNDTRIWWFGLEPLVLEGVVGS